MKSWRSKPNISVSFVFHCDKQLVAPPHLHGGGQQSNETSVKYKRKYVEMAQFQVLTFTLCPTTMKDFADSSQPTLVDISLTVLAFADSLL